MNPDVILLRYGELSLKSAYVRKYFEMILLRNLKKAFSIENVPCESRTERGRIYLSTKEISKGIMILPRIFGIVSFSPATQTTSTLQDISETAQHIAKNILNQRKSFAIRVTRVGLHPYTSQDVAVQIGNDIVISTHAKVDLNTPDLQLFIEIREKKSFLFTEKMKGVGGLPMGTQGTILVLVTRPSSLLAAWYLMRRGCNCVLVTTHDSNENAIRSFLTSWYAEAEILSIDRTSKQFLKQLSKIISEKHCEAIATDDTFETPAQTLAEIAQLKKYIDVPVLTPLLTMTKAEIEHQCVQRGVLL